MPRRNKRVTIRATSVPELHQWLRAYSTAENGVERGC